MGYVLQFSWQEADSSGSDIMSACQLFSRYTDDNLTTISGTHTIQHRIPIFHDIPGMDIDLVQKLELRRQLDHQAGASNDPLPHHEQLIIRELLTDAESELHLVDTEISSTQAILNALHARRAESVTRVTRLRTAISPHKNLPPEIMSKIFMNSRSSDRIVLPYHPGSSPWNVSQVCSRWRQIALCESRLWNSVLLPYIKYRRHPIDVIPATQHVFARCGDRTIDFDLEDWRTFADRDPDGNLDGNPIPKLVRPYKDRFRNLTLSLPYSWFHQFFELQPGSIESLESVNLTFLDHNYTQTRTGPILETIGNNITVFQHARSLRKFQLRAQGWYALILPRTLGLLWSQLTEVMLVQLFISPAMALTILHQCSNLEKCNFFLEERNDDLPPDLPVNIASGNLKSMTLHAKDEEFIDFIHPLILPSLKVINFDLECCLFSVIVALIQRSRCSLQSIHLRSLFASTILETVLEFTPSLAELIIPSCIITASALERMSRNELLPRLIRLDCRVDVPSAFVDMLERRSQRLTSGVLASGFKFAFAACDISIPSDAAIKRLDAINWATSECLNLEGKNFNL
jgi:F-box-like